MNAEELRARILATDVEPIEGGLLDQLRQLPQVHSARSDWYHGWVQISVVLSDWTWDAQAAASDIIDAFAREYVREFSVTSRFHPVELRP